MLPHYIPMVLYFRWKGLTPGTWKIMWGMTNKTFYAMSKMGNDQRGQAMLVSRPILAWMLVGSFPLDTPNVMF